MKLLIIGASGFIGNAALEYFSKQHEVVGVDLVDFHSKHIVIDTDFSQTQTLIEHQKFDVVLNCAGSSNVKGSFLNTDHDFNLNVSFVQTILNSIKTNSPKTKFINLSSAAVYGDAPTLPIQEDHPLEPISPYGFHKLLSEQVMREYCKLFGISTVSVRIFSAYGCGLKRQFIYDLYSKFQSNSNVVTLYGTGRESRDFIFITDIIHALDVIIAQAPFAGEVYNVASGTESFIDATAALFARISQYHGEISFMDSQIEGYPINWRADISKLKALGFSPKVSMEEGLEAYYKWIKSNFN